MIISIEGREHTRPTGTARTDSPLACILAAFGQPSVPPAEEVPVQSAPAGATPATAIALAVRLGELQRHIARRAENPHWRKAWNKRLGTPTAWQSPGRVATALIEDVLEPAAAAGDVALFDEWERYIRVDLLDGAECDRLTRKESEAAP
jgi:hypothetical protein